MTKIKNTKKGMAKKTLSISLAVAMLATSNVPVWAAEFTDGTDAAFTSEAPAEVVEEAPVVDEVTDTEVAPAEVDDPTLDSRYEVEYKDVPSSMEWDDEKTIGIKIYDKVDEEYVTDNTGFKVRFLDDNGQLEGGFGADINLPAVEADGFAYLPVNFKPWVKEDHSLIGKNFRVQVYNTNDNNETGYAQASSPIKLEKVTLKGTVDVTGANNEKNWYKNWNLVVYTGKPVEQGPTLKGGIVNWTNGGINWDHTELIHDSSFPITGSLDTKDCEVHGDDIVNAFNYSGKTLTATNRIIDPLYQGTLTTTFAIEPKVLTDDNFEENIKITLPYYDFEYTGAMIKVPSKKATVTDLNSGKVIAGALTESDIWINKANAADGTVTAVGNYNDDDRNTSTYIKAWLKKIGTDTKTTLDNYVLANNNISMLRRVNGAVTVSARDLTSSNTEISFKKVNNESLTNGSYVTDDGLMNNIKIKDVQTGVDITDSLKGELKITFNGKEDLAVEVGKTYKATVSPADAKSKNITGTRDVDFTVIGHDLAAAKVDNETELEKDAKYTGSQITKNVTAENFEEKIGVVKYYENAWRNLVKDQEYSTTPEFGENLNVGKAHIYINGLGTFAGTQKDIEFDITAREADSLNVPASIPYEEGYEMDDYEVETSVTATFKDEWTGEKKTLTVPSTDYTITREFVDANKNKVSAPVKGGYIKTTVTQNTAVNSNFDLKADPEGTKEAVESQIGYTKLTKKEITKEHVILNKDTYTYTGKDIEVDYKVVYNGETLVKGVDYEETLVNGVNVGEGTLVITGKGDYEETPVSLKFQITPAKTSDVTVVYKDAVYDGTAHKDINDVTLKLGDVVVTNQFKIAFPTSKTANINAGEGKLTLTPVKGNKNFEGTADATFVIAAAEMETQGAKLNSYNDKESLVKWYDGTQAEEFKFTYDGSEKSYAKNIYKPAAQGGSKVVAATDWEVRYADNVHGLMTYKGGKSGRAFALVIAKGNYVGTKANISVDGTQVVKDGVYTCEDGTKITNVVGAYPFIINHREIHKSNVTVANGEYKAGLEVDPVVTINYNGKELVEGIDFELDYSAFPKQDRTKVTNGKTLSVKLAGKGGYYLADDLKNASFAWGIDKFNLANAQIIVNGTDAAPEVTVLNNGRVVETTEYDLVAKDGKATITAKAESKNYTGSKEFDIKEALEKPETPMIEKVTVVGNKATVVLSGECEGAVGYDYVISPNANCINDKDYTAVNKNKLTTETTFQYVQPDTYYAYCHAWVRDENGKKVFSDWSKAYPFMITATTPDQPVITNVKVKGSTVTVTYTKAANADGYDVVLGSEMATVYDEKRPVEYGTLVKKNQKTTTVTFKNVPDGTYYVGLHAFNRTSVDGKKVFSPWSNAKKIRVK